FTGTALPPLIGQMVDVNANNDESDIYQNISFDPLIRDSLNFTPLGSSPVINAGRATITDVDGTVSDIGARFFNFGYVPQDLAADSSGNNYVSFSWDITATDSLTGYNVYYRDQAGDWIFADFTTNHYFTFYGLTNNQIYEFQVKAKYNQNESNASQILEAVPGVSSFILSHHQQVLENPGGTLPVEFSVENNGNKDLHFPVFGPMDANLENILLKPDSTVSIIDTLNLNENSIASYIYRVLNLDEGIADTMRLLSINGIQSQLPAQYFTAVDSSDSVFYFVVTNAYIDNSYLETGDEIALYAGNTCVGAGMYNGRMPFLIKGFSSTGFTNGDSIHLKLWDQSSSRYAESVTITWYEGEKSFYTGAFARVSLNASIYSGSSLALKGGRFNLISLAGIPAQNYISSLFSSLQGLKIIYEDNGSVYLPELNINTIQYHDITEAYHLFYSGADTSLDMSLMKLNRADWPLTIENNRFNSIAYLMDENASCDLVL
ncbi:MAG: fibronectin type III domain-containing protein, partial [Candidatus Marinimicrobia bacterium]|nr:fibronectin type III domain-containing protein [Candidatus Neomarinimicrobiota bacterium]